MDKEELSRKLNEILGLEKEPIDFTKLSKSDLERLYNTLSNVLQIAQVGVRTLKSRVEGGGLLLKPVREVANMRVIDLLANIRKEGGVLGMLDALLQERTKTAKK
jgi:nucleotidyltransferase/DNA polymerase involved in DNA repair